jgi:hypothetical protein
MTEMSLEQMLKIVQKNVWLREQAYQIASEKRWYTKDDAGRNRYNADLDAITSHPAEQIRTGNYAARSEGRDASREEGSRERTPQVESAQAAARGYASASFASFSPYEKQMMIADSVIRDYVKGQEIKSFMGNCVAGFVLAGALYGLKQLFNADETVIQGFLKYTGLGAGIYGAGAGLWAANRKWLGWLCPK